MSFSDSNNKYIDKKQIEREQLDRIIDAILAGKYSWACFLLLRCIDCDPLHYIPYRTYNRLVKENGQVSRATQIETKHTPANKRSNLIQDLEYLEVGEQQNSYIRGGTFIQLSELKLSTFEPVLPQLQTLFVSK